MDGGVRQRPKWMMMIVDDEHGGTEVVVSTVDELGTEIKPKTQLTKSGNSERKNAETQLEMILFTQQITQTISSE